MHGTTFNFFTLVHDQIFYIFYIVESWRIQARISFVLDCDFLLDSTSVSFPSSAISGVLGGLV